MKKTKDLLANSRNLDDAELANVLGGSVSPSWCPQPFFTCTSGGYYSTACSCFAGGGVDYCSDPCEDV